MIEMNVRDLCEVVQFFVSCIARGHLMTIYTHDFEWLIACLRARIPGEAFGEDLLLERICYILQVRPGPFLVAGAPLLLPSKKFLDKIPAQDLDQLAQDLDQLAQDLAQLAQDLDQLAQDLAQLAQDLPKILPKVPRLCRPISGQDLAQSAKIMPAKILGKILAKILPKILAKIWQDLSLLARSWPPAKILLFLARTLPKNFLLGRKFGVVGGSSG